MRDFSPPTAPPSRTAHSTSFLLLLRPLSLLAQSVPFILHSSFATAAPAVAAAAAAAGRSLSLFLSAPLFLFLSLSLSPILLLLRHAGLFSSLFVPWWRTFATYAADTPLDTSCTILDLLISRPECTDAHTGMRSGAAHRLACAHARTRYTKGSSPFREMIFNNRPTGKCEKVRCVRLVSR